MVAREKKKPGAHRVDPGPSDEHTNGEERRSRFRLLTVPELLNRPPREYLVRGILGRGELAVLFGLSDSGKTFIAVSVAMSLASGQKWDDRDVHPGFVVYVAAEGTKAFGARLKAWIKVHGQRHDLRMRVLEEPVQFMQDEDVDGFIAALEALPDRPVLIVIDTLHRCMVDGDENLAKDMGKVISGCDRIRRATGASVLLIHHSARGHKGERGSSALRGAVDTALAASHPNERDVILSCVKQKDEARFEDLPFDLQVVDLGTDEEGHPLSSCVLVPKGRGTAKGESHGGLGPAESQMYQVLRDRFFESGATSDEWMLASKVARSTFYRHRKRLVDAGYVERFDHGSEERFRIGKRYHDAAGPTVPPSPTQSQASGETSPTPPPPLKGEAGRTGTGTETGNDSSSPRRKGQGR